MTGVLLLSQGLSESGQTSASRALIVVTLVGGILILGGMIARRRLGERFRYFHAMVCFFEGLTCAFVGVTHMQRGTSYIQFAWLLAAIGFLAATVVRARQAHRSRAPATVAVER
jgi:hypothetical protein